MGATRGRGRARRVEKGEGVEARILSILRSFRNRCVLETIFVETNGGSPRHILHLTPLTNVYK